MLNVIILAAGHGKRMQSQCPKVLHHLAGRPLLDYVLQSARDLNPDRIVVVVGYGADQIRAAYKNQADLYFAHQASQQGTAHAVSQALPFLLQQDTDNCLNHTSLILYGDVPLIQPLSLRQLLQARGPGLALLTQYLQDPSGYGRIVRDELNHIQFIVEHKDACETQRKICEVNTGILAAPTHKLKDWLSRINNDNAQKEFYLTDIVGLAASEKFLVKATHPGAFWETQGINDRGQQAALERIWQTEQAQRLLNLGVTLADPHRFDLRGTLNCGQDVFIDVGCVFEGNVELGNAVHIGPHCVLRDVKVGSHTRIEAFSHLQGTQIGEFAKIGPYARLRPGTQLAEHTQVGNFVELKNTTLGAASKANHLSYLGDAQIGSRVNVGAGTITCNYDGYTKHVTVIEDDAFIGSNTQLVAPVRVSKGATVGAGTTLTREAPAHSLTLARAKQVTIAGWQHQDKNKKGVDTPSS